MRTVAAGGAVQRVSSRRLVTQFVGSFISSLAGFIGFDLIAPTISRIAAVGPALKGFYGTHIVGWFGTLEKMFLFDLPGS